MKVEKFKFFYFLDENTADDQFQQIAVDHEEVVSMVEDETPFTPQYTEIEFLHPSHRARGKFQILNSTVCY